MQGVREKKSDEEVVISVEDMEGVEKKISSATSVGSKDDEEEKGDETLPLGDEGYVKGLSFKVFLGDN